MTVIYATKYDESLDLEGHCVTFKAGGAYYRNGVLTDRGGHKEEARDALKEWARQRIEKLNIPEDERASLLKQI